MRAFLSITCAVVVCICVCARGIGTEIIPESKYIYVGGTITAINNTSSGLSVKITNTTTSQVLHTAVVPAQGESAYTVAGSEGDVLRTVMTSDAFPLTVWEDVTHTVAVK